MTIQKFTIILFQLPDEKLVLQRRTNDAPYAPGKLGIFGGWVEEGEAPKECLLREIKEETSLDAKTLSITSITDFVIPPSSDFDKPRHFYLYKTHIPHLNFAVYEGDGAEAYALSEFRQRDDLTSSAVYVFDKVLDENLAVKT